MVSETEVNTEVGGIVKVEEILGDSETQRPSPRTDLYAKGHLKFGIGQIRAGCFAPNVVGEEELGDSRHMLIEARQVGDID